MVRERGWLPGIGLSANYEMQDWLFGLAGEVHHGDLEYDGRLQGGTRFASETGTSTRRIRFEAGRRISDATRLIAAIEHDEWKRNIRGRDNVAGIWERYTSRRILAGAQSRIARWEAGSVEMKALAVFSRPERLDVRFGQQLFDDVSFRTRSAVGLRLGLGFRPASVPNLSLEAEIDWIKIASSEPAVLRKNGARVGTVMQPEHERSAFGLRMNYRF